MKNFSLSHIPCGTSIPPDNPHAISVSLPAFSDVIGYEEKTPLILDKLNSAYPRFRMNKLNARAASHIKEIFDIGDKIVLPISSPDVLEFMKLSGSKEVQLISSAGYHTLAFSPEYSGMKDIISFLQHTGMIPSSRKSEDYLFSAGEISNTFSEKKESPEQSINIINSILLNAYGTMASPTLHLTTTGMNAVFSVFEALNKKLHNPGNHFVQLGWLYLDTMEILNKFGKNSVSFFNCTDTEGFISYIRQNHKKMTAVFTEVPTNPLVQIIDLPRVSAELKKYNIPLIIDSSMGTAYNYNLLEYSDIVIESLTKFASGGADLMMGAIIYNNKSEIALSLQADVEKYIQHPYHKDVERLARGIHEYETRVTNSGERTRELAEYLNKSKIVSRVFWSNGEYSKENEARVKRNEKSVSAVISIIFDKPLKFYYDRIRLPKGPSFGTEFTLAMPYVYLAHYDLTKTESGRATLSSIGLDSEMLRISVGTEPINDLIRVFEDLI